LVAKPEGKRLLGRPKLKWEDNITVYLSKIGWEAVNWMHLAQVTDHWRALVNRIMNLRIP
jgi:hypothetical protein